MALSQSALSELAEVFRTGEGTDFIRECVRVAMQELIDAEATAAIGAGRYERTESRTTERNGSRPRLLTTHAGDVQLTIPKLRAGSFFPSILSPRRRIDQALYAVVMEAYVHGVSTQSWTTWSSRWAGPGSPRARCRGSARAWTRVSGAFRTRRLDHVEFPYVYLDATYLHVRTEHGMVVSKAVVVATGVTARDAGRSWAWMSATARTRCSGEAFLTSLKKRGLTGVKLVISDQHAGLVAAIPGACREAAHQRCRVHFIRNVLAHVAKAETEMVAAVFRTIFAQPDLASMSQAVGQGPAELAARYPKIGTSDGRSEGRGPRLRRVPAGALAQDLVHQPTRYLEPASGCR
jgi:putative transposase